MLTKSFDYRLIAPGNGAMNTTGSAEEKQIEVKRTRSVKNVIKKESKKKISGWPPTG